MRSIRVKRSHAATATIASEASAHISRAGRSSVRSAIAPSTTAAASANAAAEECMTAQPATPATASSSTGSQPR